MNSSFTISVVLCILGMVMMASAQSTSMASRTEVLNREFSTVARGTTPSFLSRGSDDPVVKLFSTCPASSGYFRGRKFKMIAKCDPTAWFAGGTFSQLAQAPTYLESEIFQSRTKLFPTLNGDFGETYVQNTVSDNGKVPFIGHAHWGLCDPNEFGPPESAGALGVTTGAHVMYNTEQTGYGFDFNEIWYTGNLKKNSATGQVKNYKGFRRQWGLPVDAGALPQFPDLLTPSGGVEEVGFRGTQGNVPGSVVLHKVDEVEGGGIKTGVQWACCQLMYEEAFCDSIGGCKVFDKVTGAFVDAPLI